MLDSYITLVKGGEGEITEKIPLYRCGLSRVNGGGGLRLLRV